MSATSSVQGAPQPPDPWTAPGHQGDLSQLKQVSDTAFWTAAIRARELERADPMYADPYAAALAGEKGRLIANRLGQARELSWGVNMRTVSIDRLILDACARGLDSVINLGAGLDSRPYRLPIPAHVTWFEADMPDLIDYKNGSLAGASARCTVTRIGADLATSRGRRRVLARIAYGSSRSLVLAEGLIPYLSAQEVAGLARDLHEERSVQAWIVDYDGGGSTWAPAYRKHLEAVPRRFQMPHILAFLKYCSWEVSWQMGAGDQASEFGRAYPVGFPRSLLWRVLPRSWQAHMANLSGVALLQRG